MTTEIIKESKQTQFVMALSCVHVYVIALKQQFYLIDTWFLCKKKQRGKRSKRGVIKCPVCISLHLPSARLLSSSADRASQRTRSQPLAAKRKRDKESKHPQLHSISPAGLWMDGLPRCLIAFFLACLFLGRERGLVGDWMREEGSSEESGKIEQGKDRIHRDENRVSPSVCTQNAGMNSNLSMIIQPGWEFVRTQQKECVWSYTCEGVSERSF
mmetsp:Transcript_2706/g.5587  ORF Transcript_2706/g.5587 Transcript_2706/m.5587 type:complete len:214 (-) Transcript_2706:437-1078(-)